jgi:putative transport protein
VLGTLLVIWLLPIVGPWLMRVNLSDACRQLEQSMGLESATVAQTSTYRDIVARAYRVPDALAGRSVADLEALWPREARAVVERIRRRDTLIDATAEMALSAGDVVAITGPQSAVLHESGPLLEEIDDRELLNIPIVSADLVLTRRSLTGRPVGEVAEAVGARNIFVRNVRRAGRDLPVGRNTLIQRGDVLSVAGRETEIGRVAAHAGYVEYRASDPDLILVGGAIVIGGLLGSITIAVGAVDVGLSAPVGVLLVGLLLGHLRLIYPRLGRVPDESLRLFESLGLASFLALVGLGAGPGLGAALRESGVLLLVAGALLSVGPHLVTILVGRYIVGMHPGILLGICAGAGTSAPALAELEKAAQSKIPTLGYGLACAVGNVLLALSGTVLVLAGQR